MSNYNEALASRNTKSIKLAELAEVFGRQDTDTQDRDNAMRDLITELDEKFFKSSKIDKRGDFLEMCGFERN
jgi:hypothetical protein